MDPDGVGPYLVPMKVASLEIERIEGFPKR